ncbi:MAG: hypothetical protein J6W88_01680 [Bacteroidales bacterium]|nr:hypothetical protein [Bacteroidales bacterium]
MMKRRIPYLFAVVALATVTLVGCHKTCTCDGYDGLEHTYTAEEVDARASSCSAMRDFPVLNHYSVCSWD